MKARNKRRLLSCSIALLILALVAAAGMMIRQALMDIRQKEAGSLLHYYSENIMLQLQGSLNKAEALAQIALVMGEDTAWFESAAAPLLEKEEVHYVALIQGDTMVSALPKAEYGHWAGRDLQDFSYIYTMAKVVKELVVEGPVFLEDDASQRQVFLFLQPVVRGGAYLGEAVVALDRAYVLEQFGLDELSAQGYDYELWRVEPQSGGKEVVAASRPDADFSYAAKTTFYLPTQWNLSIQPTDGWMPAEQLAVLVAVCILAAALLLGLFYCSRRLFVQQRKLDHAALTDSQTGLCNRAGFIVALDEWLGGTQPLALFYFVFAGYDQISQLIAPEEEAAFLRGIPGHLQEYIQSPFLAGRLGAGNFILAVREDMSGQELEDFAKGLSLELLLKVRLNGERHFLTAGYQYTRCEQGAGAREALSGLISAYYARLSQESPVQMMTEKCRRLIEGRSDVVFDEYTDLDMMELSKAFNQYRKQVEQLAYSDPMFGVGNRPKFLRDVNMLISYEKKRPFSLFCVDIRAFSQYNELFGSETGDAILHEMLRRLSRPFGTYVYRINGDVFLGVSLSAEEAEPFAARLLQMLTVPLTAGSNTFSVQVRIAVCRYPANGDSPTALLGRVQSALNYAKQAGQEIVVYSDALDEMIRTEADILQRLKCAIQQRTLEVWYQPMMYLGSGRFTAAEALIRLPDGRGGYFPAQQVISLAERNGLVERLGDYVLEQACRFMHDRGLGLGLAHIGVNLSVQQLWVEQSADHLLEIIRACGIPPQYVTLEITESVLIQSIEQASATLDQLRQAGVRIALDDFGVGYSSLNYLSNLPVDVIKIDRSLTRQILTNKKQRTLLQSIVNIADINALTVVAEGVETGDEQQMISASGVQYIQGFYYARPMLEDALLHFLAGHSA